MKISIFRGAVLLSLLLSPVWFSTNAMGASADLASARKEAEAKGYTFLTSRDEIVAQAKKEGKLRVLAEMEPPNIKASTEAFMKKYPFIDLFIQEKTGTDEAQRNILEVKAGAAKDWDILHLSPDFHNEYIPYLWKIDLLAMAQHGVLAIPPEMIDPKDRSIVAYFNRFHVTAYNKDLISPDQLPRTWEDLLKPEFKGKKFAADIRPFVLAALVPAWGLEKTLKFAQQLAAQDPVWVRGATRTLTAMRAGEIALFPGPNWNTVKRVQEKDPLGKLQYVILEPVPVRIALAQSIQAGANNPHAALLWLEWMASLEAQELIDKYEPLASSIYVRGGAVERELRGKKLSVASWEHHLNMQGWMSEVFKAYGFPKTKRRR